MPPLSLPHRCRELKALAQALHPRPLPWWHGVTRSSAIPPSCAFFVGYQIIALRHLDPSLSPSEWAAFAVSEKP